MHVPVPCSRHNIGQSTFYRWETQYVGVSEAQRFKHLEEENRKLKSLVADLPLDKVMLQEGYKKT
jgi:putative transposase